MIPKIDFQTHDILTRIFIPPFKKKKEFKKEVKEFTRSFRKIEEDVLISIEKFSGFKWSKKRIPVYLIPSGRIVSFVRGKLENGLPGVVQKIFSGEEKRNLHIFIHELCHVNQFQSDFYDKNNRFVLKKDGTKDSVKVEVLTDIVTIHVVREIFGKNSDMEKDYWHFMNKVMTSTPKKKLEIPKYLKKFDLNKKTLKEYII